MSIYLVAIDKDGFTLASDEPLGAIAYVSGNFAVGVSRRYRRGIKAHVIRKRLGFQPKRVITFTA